MFFFLYQSGQWPSSNVNSPLIVNEIAFSERGARVGPSFETSKKWSISKNQFSISLKTAFNTLQTKTSFCVKVLKR